MNFLSGLISAVVCLGLALQFFQSWYFPLSSPTNCGFVSLGMVVIGMEFVGLPSAIFMAIIVRSRSILRRILPLIIFTFIYYIFAYGMSKSSGNVSGLDWFHGVMISRLLTALTTKSRNGGVDSEVGFVAFSALIYFLLLILSIVITLPSGGLTSDALSECSPKTLHTQSQAIWTKFPQQPLCMGFIYFMLQGVAHIISSFSASPKEPYARTR